MSTIRKLLDGLVDFALIVLGIPGAVAESAINRRSWTDRIADRVVEQIEARQPRMTVTNVHNNADSVPRVYNLKDPDDYASFMAQMKRPPVL